jgi:hypothetical protein
VATIIFVGFLAKGGFLGHIFLQYANPQVGSPYHWKRIWRNKASSALGKILWIITSERDPI